MVVPKSLKVSGLMSTSEVATALGAHRSTVHGWIKSGMLTSTRHGVFHGVSAEDLAAFRRTYGAGSFPKPKRKRASPMSRKRRAKKAKRGGSK